MLRHVLLLLLLPLLTTPSVAASHWTSDADADHVGDSGCLYSDHACLAAYLCTGGAPGAPDLAAYCAARAAGEALDVALWLPRFLWDWLLDYPTDAAEDLPHDLNVELCEAAPFAFCGNPVWLPEHVPAEDPVHEFPL